jgi:hypothetical protein
MGGIAPPQVALLPVFLDDNIKHLVAVGICSLAGIVYACILSLL